MVVKFFKLDWADLRTKITPDPDSGLNFTINSLFQFITTWTMSSASAHGFYARTINEENI